MTKFGSYLLFDGTCSEAMAFYRSCFGGEFSLTTVGDSPMKAQFPTQQHAKVINARLKSGAIDISASDWLHPARIPAQGNNICVYISEGTYQELSAYFAMLSQGADPDLLDPLVERPFGTYGALTDIYGVRWMFQGNSKLTL